MAPPSAPLRLLFTADVHNTTAPCGCMSNPLGDVSRLAHLVRQGAGGSLLMDAGGLLYDEGPVPPDQSAQVQLKARFLAQTFGELGALGTLQPEDLAHGDPARGLARVASNLDVEAAGPAAQRWGLRPWALRQLGPVKVGVLGVLAPEGPWPFASAAVRDPRLVLPALIQGLRRDGAQIVVALTGLGRAPARRLARAVPGLDVIIAGGRVESGVQEPEQVEGPDGQPGAVLLVPAKQAEQVARLTLYHYDKGPTPPHLRLVASAAARAREQERLSQQREQAGALLATLRADPQADPAFVKTTEAEVQRLAQALAAARRAAADVAPPGQPYATAELVPLNKAVPRDPLVVRGMEALDHEIGVENLKQVTTAPPPPLPGQPRYLGMQGAGGCLGSCHWHDDALRMWQGSHHAQAWNTLLAAGKELSLECVSCHATGYGQLGGANLRSLWENDHQPGQATELRNVGCEDCHGPGSLHAAAPSKVPMPVPRPKPEVCASCHTKEHSDTFDAVPYLRDILGAGHGEEARAALGTGVTGHELRQAALKRAEEGR